MIFQVISEAAGSWYTGLFCQIITILVSCPKDACQMGYKDV